jgi:hypothetical protein
MTISEVRDKVEEELRRGDSFNNSHGITKENIRLFLVEPYEVTVDPDDLETAPRKMWVVLHQLLSTPQDGYLVTYDSMRAGWSVTERSRTVDFVQVVAAKSLAAALEAM